MGTLDARNSVVADPLYSNAAGGVWVAPSLLAVVPAEDAWIGIQELHHAAIGDESFVYVTDAGGLGPDDAFVAYSNAVVGVLGQLAGTSPAAADVLLGSLTSHVDLSGSMEGLEGLGLSAYGAASMLPGVTGNMDAYQSVLQQLGIPDIGGGGMPTTPVFNKALDQFGLPVTGYLQQAVSGLGAFTGHGSGYANSAMGHMLGEAAGLGASALGPGAAADFKRVGEVLGATGAGAAEGALIGSVFGPVGAAVVGVVGGVIGFFTGLFGGDDPASKQNDAGHGVATGTQVIVNAPNTVVNITNNYTIQVGRDGSSGPAPSGVQGPQGGAPGGSGQCLAPRPEKCPVDDDGTIGADFSVPFWRQEAFLLASASPIGPGVEGLATASADGAMLMAPFPEVDLAAVMVDGGEVFEAQLKDAVATDAGWVLTDPGGAATDAGTDQWINVEVATRVPTRPPVVEAELVEVLRAEGFGPSTRTSTVLRELARRYPAASGRGFR